jgi:hypothetical protein
MPAVITAITLLQACSSKDFDHCNEELVVKATADTSVIVGSTLKLSATGVEAEKVEMYNWYGPNKFSSHAAAPEIKNVTGAGAGRYSVDIITKDGCIYKATTDSVKVLAITPPCTATNNYIEFSNLPGKSISSINTKIEGDSYVIYDYNGNLRLDFVGTNRPPAGIYTTRNDSDPKTPGNVRMLSLNSGYYWHPDSNYKVYVNASNGKLIITMCDVPGLWNGYKSVVKMQVTVP